MADDGSVIGKYAAKARTTTKNELFANFVMRLTYSLHRESAQLFEQIGTANVA